MGEEKNHGNVTINLKIKKTIYLKILQIKIVSFFSKKKAEEMYNNLNGNDFVKLKSIVQVTSTKKYGECEFYG